VVILALEAVMEVLVDVVASLVGGRDTCFEPAVSHTA
jgi:hypothetical protein